MSPHVPCTRSRPQAKCPGCSKPLTVDLTATGATANGNTPAADDDGDNDVGDYIGGGAADAGGGGCGGRRGGRGGGRGGGGGGALAGLGGMLGYRPKKQSILTRIGDLSRFQTSTKIEVGQGPGRVGGQGTSVPRMLAPPCKVVRTTCDRRSRTPRRQALREELQRMTSSDPSAKAIVFSQFTSMLDLVHYRLEQVG